MVFFSLAMVLLTIMTAVSTSFRNATSTSTAIAPPNRPAATIANSSTTSDTAPTSTFSYAIRLPVMKAETNPFPPTKRTSKT